MSRVLLPSLLLSCPRALLLLPRGAGSAPCPAARSGVLPAHGGGRGRVVMSCSSSPSTPRALLALMKHVPGQDVSPWLLTGGEEAPVPRAVWSCIPSPLPSSGSRSLFPVAIPCCSYEETESIQSYFCSKQLFWGIPERVPGWNAAAGPAAGTAAALLRA